jgi:hypothetical protein
MQTLSMLIATLPPAARTSAEEEEALSHKTIGAIEGAKELEL